MSNYSSLDNMNTCKKNKQFSKRKTSHEKSKIPFRNILSLSTYSGAQRGAASQNALRPPTKYKKHDIRKKFSTTLNTPRTTPQNISQTKNLNLSSWTLNVISNFIDSRKGIILIKDENLIRVNSNNGPSTSFEYDGNKKT